MEWLFDLMDLPENLQRGLFVVRPIKGLAAGIMAAVLFALCWLLWPWLWYFDIESTAVWSEAALTALGATLGSAALPMANSYASNTAWFITGSTFIPSLVELFTVRFASGGIKAARILVLFFATFDLVTDWPRVSEFLDGFNLGLWGLALKVPLLLLASFGLESLFIVFLICGVALLFNVQVPVGRAQATTGAKPKQAGAPAGSVDV
jgi:hypothetical protein